LTLAGCTSLALYYLFCGCRSLAAFALLLQRVVAVVVVGVFDGLSVVRL